MTEIQTFTEKIINNIEKVIVGKRSPVELAIISLIMPGTFADRRCAWGGKNRPGTQPCQVIRMRIQPDPIHTRYAPQ